MLAGDRDRVIPLGQSRRVFEAAGSEKELVVLPGAAHNDVELLAGDETIGAIDGFLSKLRRVSSAYNGGHSKP